MKNIKGQSFLITGGTGFLGKNIVPFLNNLGAYTYPVGKRNYDLTSNIETTKLFNDIKSTKFDYIIHGACVQAAGDWPLKHKTEQYDSNLQIHTNILRGWHLYQPQAKMIGICTSCSYPGVKEILKESEYWDGPMHDSVNIYGFTKKAINVGIDAYKSQYGLKGTTVVLATLYGKYDHFDPEKSHVVSALIKKFVDARVNNFPNVEIWGDGSQMREIIYVDDQIKGILSVIDYDGSIINIGSGFSISIKELAEIIKELSNYEGEIIYNTNKFVGIKKKVLDISLAREKYGWTTNIPIDNIRSSLKKTIEFYESL